MPSFVWEHFTKSGDTTICAHCGASLAFKSGNTSSMKHHLSARHSITDPETRKRKFEENQDEPDATVVDVKPALKRATTSPPSLAAFLASAPKNGEKITSLIVQMLADDLLPIRTVEHSGFRELLKYLAPTYSIPCRRSITARLGAKYDELIQKAISLFESSDIDGVGLTADLWTSIATQGFIGVTAHFIDSTWEMRSVALASEQMEESHTGVNIAQRLTEIASTFKIVEKVQGFIHDNAANCNVAARELAKQHGWNHQPCVGHTLQLSVKEGLTDRPIAQMLATARRIVGYFNRSSVAMTKLHKTREQQGQKQLGLVQDCPTRWNSTHAMLERLEKMEMAVTLVLQNEPGCGHLKMSGTQWDMAKDLVKILRPLQIATTVLSAQYQPSISCVFPILHGLKTEHLASREGDSAIVKRLKSAIRTDLVARFPDNGNYILAWLASALDPRFKSLTFLSEDNKTAVWKHLGEELKKVTPAPDEAADKESAGGNEGEVSALAFLLGSNTTTGAANDESSSELQRYRQELCSVDSGPPLQWWKANCKRFPNLAKVAKKVLAIPATSTPTERLFSTAGLVCHKKRARLLPENVDKLVFLHENRKFLDSVKIKSCR